jgi:hypothetical protein
VIRGLVVVVLALFWLLVLRLVLRAIGSALAPAASRPAQPGPQARAPEDLVLDPVCRTYVPRSRAIRARVSGREESFCSAACRDRALASVARAS